VFAGELEFVVGDEDRGGWMIALRWFGSLKSYYSLVSYEYGVKVIDSEEGWD
jgi:hypothetical protein